MSGNLSIGSGRRLWVDSVEFKVASIAFITMLIYLIVCIYSRSPDNDVVNFFYHAENIKMGIIPYRDYVFELPPLSLIFFVIPDLFDSDCT